MNLKLIKKICSAAVLSSIFFTGCNSEILNGSKNQEYGNLVISNKSDALAVDVSSIKSTKVVVSGSGILAGMEPSSELVNVEDGKASVNVYNIPVGKNRIVTCQAYDSSSNEIKSCVLRAVTYIKSGNNTVYVGWDTTALGNVFNALNIKGYDVSSVNQDDINIVEAAIKKDVEVNLIDYSAIAKDFILYKEGKISGLKAPDSYVLGVDDENIIFYVHKSTYANSVPYIWAWNGSVTSENYTGGTWPGKKLELCDDNIWYTFTVEKTSCMAIISNNGSDKSDDNGREFTSGSWYYYNKKWYDGNPLDSEPPVCSWESYPSGTVTGVILLSVNASDNIAIKKIELYVDDKLYDTITTGSSFSFDTSVLKNGNHTIYAVAYDSAGNTGKTQPVGVCSSNENRAPVAVITDSDKILVNVAKSLSSSESYDPNGSIVSYSWSFGDGSTASGENVKHTWTTAGEYTVELLVTDDDGATGYASMKMTVLPEGSFVHRDFREERVYFMMTDRFCDGDKNNNNIWGDEYLPKGESQMYDYSEDESGVLSYYHGGDFKGIIKHLDYIKEMGFTAIWITPVVWQCEGRYYWGDYSASPFHGYWAYDFDKIDPHLASSGVNSDGWDDYKEFIAACHEKGIRVMQDIVCNHGHLKNPQAPTKWIDEAFTVKMDGHTWVKGTDADKYYDPLNLDNGFFTYHAHGASCVELIDFNEQGAYKKDAREHLKNVYKKFIDAGVDAFRIDTVAYMTASWWGEFADDMYNYAKSKGNDYFYMVGEAWGGRGPSLDFHKEDKTDSFHQLDMTASCLDYPGRMRSSFENNGNYGQYLDIIAEDPSHGYTKEEETWSGMFVDNHDCARSNGWLNVDQYKNALTYIYLFNGVPIVYYGTEAMYAWEGAKATTNKADVCARWMLGDKGIEYVKNNKPVMYKHLKVLNKVHEESVCIQKGEQDNIALSGDKAAFTREYKDKKAYVLVNKGGSSLSHSFSVNDGNYTLYSYDGNTLTTSSVTGGKDITLTSPANGFALLDPK